MELKSGQLIFNMYSGEKKRVVKHKRVSFCLLLNLFALIITASAFGAKPWERIVPQDVITKAIEFLGIDISDPNIIDPNHLTLITEVRVDSTHTDVYEIHAINDEDRKILLGVDPESYEVVKEVRFCPRHDNHGLARQVHNANDAIDVCLTYLSSNSLAEPGDAGFSLIDEVTLQQQGPEWYYQIRYQHVVDEVPVSTDFMLFEVDPNHMVIRSYSKVYHDVTVSTEPNINMDTNNAEVLAREFLNNHTAHDPCMLSVAGPDLEIVYPNHYFDSLAWQWTDQQALIWNVRFEEAGGDAVVDVWVDAHTGQIQGGQSYERPNVEKFATTNQHKDLNIWDNDWGGRNWDHFPRMQYNDTEHRLGYNPPPGTKANVINAISNGTNHVWMLQTHGGYSSNRP